MRQCVLLVYAFAMSLTSACNRSEAKEADRTLPSMSPPVTVPTSPDARGYYLGVSDDEAWFIYLEPGSAASTMYRPWESLALCDVRTDAGGAVTFRSAAGVRDPFQFAGRLSHDTLAGTMSMIRERTGAVKASWSIAPRRVLPRFLTGAPDSLSGMYQKFEMGTEDISGREVVLLDLADRVVGFAQDYSGGPTLVWDITGNRVRDTLHLTWRSKKWNHPSASPLLIRGDTLTRYDGDAQGTKRYSIPEMFRAPHRAECK
jgi:hypothetical protein